MSVRRRPVRQSEVSHKVTLSVISKLSLRSSPMSMVFALHGGPIR